MKVLFAASEGSPFVKTGGLGEVVGYLPRALKKQGVEARVVLPKYEGIDPFFKEKMEFQGDITVPVGWRNQYCGIYKQEHLGVTFYFLDNEYYFKRPGPYGYGDEGERFAYFSRAVLECLPLLDFTPQILHLHDWPTAVVSPLLQAHYGHKSFYQDMRTLLTIHNLHYQGVFPKEILGDLLSLGWDYFKADALEFYDHVNFLKGGIIFSDYLSTVSKTYAWEIQTPFFGEGLDDLLRDRKDRLYGIINGIDYEIYDPMIDPEVFVPYRRSLSKKQANKVKLQEMLGLEQDKEAPLIAFVNRMVKQKGLDLILHVFDEIMSLGVQVAVLGTGDPRYEDFFRGAAFRYPGRVSASILFDDSLSRKIYAGSDMFLMPSLFEPCGLSQLIALRYASIPIVRETGGLGDTVKPYDEKIKEGNGFSFTNYNAHDMLYTINRAVTFYRDKKTWARIFLNALEGDYSWNRSAREYRDLYQLMLEER